MRFVLGGLLFAAIGSTVVPVSSATPASAAPIERVCMSRLTTGSPGGEHLVTVAVAPTRVAALRSRGFRVASCRKAGDALIRQRQAICAMAERSNQSVDRDFSSIYGASPGELCAAVR